MTEIPVLDVDPFAPEALADPASLDSSLRDAGPVSYLPRIDAYAVARHAEVSMALRDWQHFESGAGVGLSNFRRVRKWRATSAVLEADPPEHDAPRRVLAEVLGPSSQQELRESWLAAARRLVAGLLDRPGPVAVDGVRDIAAAFPLQVVPDAIGIGPEGRENLMPFSDFLLNAFGPRNELVRAGQAQGAPLSAWVDSRCRDTNFPHGTWGDRIRRAAERGDITHEQVPLVLRSLFAAGINTTVHALAALLFGLSRNPDQWKMLRHDPGLRGRALDEAVRWQSPINAMFRTTRGETSIGGHLLPDGVKVLVCVGAANRDPRRWPDADVFDIARSPSGHVGFGVGIHGCVGQHLARLEANCLLQALCERVATIEPAGEPVRRPNNTLNSLASVPLLLHRIDDTEPTV